MNALTRARLLDASGELVDAAASYEQALRESSTDEQIYVDLAVLYFVLLDFGETSARGLSQRFRASAWERAVEILDEADRRFGKSADVEFWRRYMRYSHLGEEFSLEDCQRLCEGAKTLDPHLHLYALSDGRMSSEEARQLRAIVAQGRTARERYMMSILDSSALRRRP